MSPRENWRGFSTSRASTMRPAQVPKMGLPAAWNFSIAGTNSHSPMSLSSVVDSPPGMMSPATSSSASGLRTRTPSIDSPRLRLRLALPSPGLEQVLLGELRRLDPDHRVAELLAHAREHIRVLVVGRRLDDRLGAPGRVARLEDPGADEDGFRPELHHERGVRRRRDPARREVADRELPGPRHPPHQLVRRAEVLRLGHQLLGRERREAADARGERAHVPHGLYDVARAGLTLRPDHRRTLADAPERLAQVARAAHERDAKTELVDVEVLVGGREDLRLVDEVHCERFEDPSLHEGADPRLGPAGDRDRLLDLLDLLHRGHPRDAAVAPDVGGDAVERPERRRPRVLRDLLLLGRRYVHDLPAP